MSNERERLSTPALDFDEPKTSLNRAMPNTFEHNTFAAFHEESFKTPSTPIQSSIVPDTEMEETHEEKDFYLENTPNLAVESNGTCFVPHSDATKTNHLTPTEETSKKLELSLDELIQQKELRLPETKRRIKKSLYASHRGGRRYIEMNSGRKVGGLSKKYVSAWRSASSSNATIINHKGISANSRMIPYNSVQSGRIRMLPVRTRHLEPYEVDPFSYGPMFNAAMKPNFPVSYMTNGPFGFPYRIPLQGSPIVNRSNCPPDEKSRMKATQLEGPYNHLPSQPLRPTGVLRCEPMDALSLAEDSALSEVEIFFPPLNEAGTGPSSCDALVVRFKNTDVLTVRKSKGDMILSSGGWRTLSTQLVLNNALKPLGLWIEAKPIAVVDTKTATKSDQCIKESDDDKTTLDKPKDTCEQGMKRDSRSHQWTVVDGKFYLAMFQDGMVVGQIGVLSRSHLLARASVVAQHLKQVKNDAMMRRQRYNASTYMTH